MAAQDVEHAVIGPRASTPDAIKAQGPQSIEETIMELGSRGLYAIPVKMFWDSEKGKKDVKFPKTYGHIVDRKSWQASIAKVISQVPNANGIALLTGPSRLFVIDVDIWINAKKLPGMELWNRLIAEHGEPSTLKAKTGSGGFHYLFRIDSPGLTRKSNFAGLKSGRDCFGIDGRALGGVLFADPACYRDGKGRLCKYEWLNGPPSYKACSELPLWLAKIVNDGAVGSNDESQSLHTSPETPIACPIDADVPLVPSILDEHPLVSNGPPNERALLLSELCNMLKEKAHDSTSTYASTLPHGLYGTYYCYRTKGPRTCYFGYRHSGSNNFNLLKRGRNVYYRCHGQECSHKPSEKLGQLSLKAALQDATTQPVHHQDDMQAIMQYTRGCDEVQRLLLKIVAEHAAPEAYFNLGRLFAYVYQIEGRILATKDSSERKKDGVYFYVWNGASWVQDASNHQVSSVFTLQMGCLLEWYEGKKQKCLEELRSEHPILQGLLSEGGDQAVSKEQAALVKAAEQACLKQRDEKLPSFGKINVQDIAGDVRRCLPAVINELFVEDLMHLFDLDDHVANAPNGLIDLRTGGLMQHHPQDLCNNCTSLYVKGASKTPKARFRAFLMDVLPPEYIDWLQMFLGYCLSGETSEELFVIMNGEGANGKSRLAAALRRAFGSYSSAGNKAIFIKPTFKANASSASTHLMHIKSKRFVTNEESEKDDHLNDSFLKEASSGKPINARELFCKTQEYIPRYKLCLFTNYRPHFPSDDVALLRRIVLMMFDFVFKLRDELDANNSRHKLMDLTLKPYFESSEGAADVLNFCVEGATRYYARKEQAPESRVLSPIPDAFRAAAQEYAAENDVLQCFIEEECKMGVSFSVTKADFVDRYQCFLYAGGHDSSLAGDGLARAMNVKGFASRPLDGKKNRMIRMLDGSGRKSGFFGIRLKTPGEMQKEFEVNDG